VSLPRVWVLRSAHSGDNTQLMALARGLGYPFTVKTFAYRPAEWLPRMTLGATLLGIDKARSDQLDPPYPDLVLCAGRATEAVARWIKAKLNRRVKLVYIGPPWSNPNVFDLVIASPQYRMADHPHVLNTALPLHEVEPAKLAAAAAAWAPRLAQLPKPLTAVLVGGGSGPYGFSVKAGERLGRDASTHATARGGSLLVTTSARTPPATADALIAALTVPAQVYRWQPDAGDNPIISYLALAEDIVVTADSISMIAEACATGKPVFLFDTEEGARAMRAEENAPTHRGPLPPPHLLGADLSATLWRIGMAYGPSSWTRDLRVVHRAVVRDGRAAWLGEKPPNAPAATGSPDLAQAVMRIKMMFGP
jgi:mitochondrial fission protein ELM1